MTEHPARLPALAIEPGRTAWLCCAQSDWLAANQPRTDCLPAEILPHLPRILREADLAVRPATAREFAVAVEQIWDWARKFDVKAAEVQSQTAKFRELLGGFPADILDGAIRETLAAQSYRTIPLPGEIRKRAAAEYERRLTIRRRARALEQRARFARPEEAVRPMGEAE
jgi:predicted Rdx family selenoprotein